MFQQGGKGGWNHESHEECFASFKFNVLPSRFTEKCKANLVLQSTLHHPTSMWIILYAVW